MTLLGCEGRLILDLINNTTSHRGALNYVILNLRTTSAKVWESLLRTNCNCLVYIMNSRSCNILIITYTLCTNTYPGGLFKICSGIL